MSKKLGVALVSINGYACDMQHVARSIQIHRRRSEGRLWVRLISREAFRQYMEFRDETNVSLGAKAGVSKAIVGHLRSGQRKTCSPKTARSIEQALNAPPGSLFLAELPHATRSTERAA